MVDPLQLLGIHLLELGGFKLQRVCAVLHSAKQEQGLPLVLLTAQSATSSIHNASVWLLRIPFVSTVTRRGLPAQLVSPSWH